MVERTVKLRGTGFEPEQDGSGMRLASLAVPDCDLQGSNPVLLAPSFLAPLENSVTAWDRI